MNKFFLFIQKYYIILTKDRLDDYMDVYLHEIDIEMNEYII